MSVPGYDSAGRHSTTDWPSGLTITNDYTALGYPSAVRQGATVLETAETLDAFGQVTRTGYGNGLATDRSFDALGRLTSLETGSAAVPKSVQDLEYTWRSNSTLYQRSDYQGTTSTGDDVTETFSYDALDRLTAANTSHSGGSRVLSFGYDGFGNLTTKTSSVATDLEVTGYQYTNPHRLTSAVIDGVLNTFVYNAAGNTTRYNAASGDDTVLDYNTRGQVERITVGLTEDKFWYGPDGARFLKQATWDDGGTQETEWTLYLAGGAYEELHPESNPDVLYRQQVQVTETVLHRRTVDPLSTVVTTFEYSHRDHLGSVDKVTDESGNVLSSLAFDPFGGRRDAAWTQELIPAGVVALLDGESTTKRGFTDHEHLDRTGFIHMNGRVYDPRIGRFTSPDPFVKSPTFSQSYNRYAYVLNSPMSLIDPSGYTDHWVAEVPVRNPNPAANFGWNFAWPGEYVAGDPNSEWAHTLWDIQNERVFVSDTTTFTPTPADPAPDPVDPDPVPESPPQTNPTSTQSPRLVDEVAQQNYAITDAERQLVADGNIQGFWESRLGVGDPVARAGLAALNPNRGNPIDYLIGNTINNRLQAFANVYADGVLDIDQVRVGLANAHIEAVTLDIAGVPGLLNPGQIAEYHHAVFEQHSLPPTAFGGTPITGAVTEAWVTAWIGIWCGGCDGQ